jgi:hypothetical protein
MTRARARSGEQKNNEPHRHSGHLLQGRHQAIPVEADPHLAELSRYLHLNPVRIMTHSQKEVPFKRETGHSHLLMLSAFRTLRNERD